MFPQIGDFGLARDLVHETYYTPTSKGAKLPVKWMAPEVHKYTAATEFWKSDNTFTMIIVGPPI